MILFNVTKLACMFTPIVQPTIPGFLSADSKDTLGMNLLLTKKLKHLFAMLFNGSSATTINYPTCKFSILSLAKFDSILTQAIEAKTPFSFIRLGDGEGVLLSLSAFSQTIDFDYMAKHFGTLSNTLSTLGPLREQMKDSMHSADIIGMRSDIVDVSFNFSEKEFNSPLFQNRFRKAFRLRPAEHMLPKESIRRIALLHDALKKFYYSKSTQFTSAWLHFDLILSGVLYRLLASQKKIGIITCYPQLSSRLQELFGLRVDCYTVPPEFSAFSCPKLELHYPDRFFKIKSELRVVSPGMLFIVGAGICGKIYCNWIKSRGGIALDLGSVFDSWMGRCTRQTVYEDKLPAFYSVNKVPAPLLLNRDNINSMSQKSCILINGSSVALDSNDHTVVINQWGIKFHVLTEAKHWLPLLRDGTWERRQRNYLIALTRDNCCDIFIDIGANNGIYTLLLSKLEQIKNVVAFEPCDPHFSLMKKSIEMNDCADKCQMYKLACSDRKTRKQIYVFPNETPSLNQLVESKIYSDEKISRLQGEVKEIDTISLDGFLKFRKRRIAIKIDAEGHEKHVIRGSTNLLRVNECVLQVESFNSDIVGAMKKLDYTWLHKIENDYYFSNIKTAIRQ